ncbi:MAG TPA: PAS domain-containing sensor histidine kinase, partial [Chloroflexota bacterium]
HQAATIVGCPIDLVLPNAATTPHEPGPIERSGRQRSGAELRIEVSLSSIQTSTNGARYGLLVMRDITARTEAEREIAQHRRTERALLESEERLQRALATQRFLDDASNELAASLDYETTLQCMARLPLPRIAEVAIVYGLDDDLVVEGVAASHLDADQEPALEPLLNCIGRRLDRLAVQDELQPIELPDVQAGNVLAMSHEQQAVLARLKLRSAMLVPLSNRGRLLGLLLLGSTSNSAWPASATALAEDLARRCALALDNARLYRTAQQAISARDQFLSIASHELRAPLARLKSHAEVLLMAHSANQLDADRLSWSVQRINASVDRLATLTKDVLDLSRLRGGHLPFRPRPVELAQFLSDLESRFADAVGERHTLRLELPPSACPVLVDQDRIEQILINLLDNAAKYSPSGDEIVLRLEAVEDGVQLSVRDRGVGLPDDAFELIFEPFGRAANAEQWNVPGMGLGLHICRLIVERHGGRIWAESDGELRGTTVHVWLPFAQESPMSSGEAKHLLTNQLTLAVGYCELLASNPALPPDVRAQALGAMHGAQGAAATLEKL